MFLSSLSNSLCVQLFINSSTIPSTLEWCCAVCPVSCTVHCTNLEIQQILTSHCLILSNNNNRNNKNNNNNIIITSALQAL